MADKPINQLTPATNIQAADLFVLEQDGQAKNMTGQVFVNWLTNYADGHGGIQSIVKTSTSGLVDTYTITYADTTTSSFVITNGKAISSITDYWAVSDSNSVVPQSWSTTMQTMTASNRYLWHYQTITYNDTTDADTTKTVVGVYGDTGQAWYVWIRYSSTYPVVDMSTTMEDYMGIHSGTESVAPSDPDEYTWFKIKGETGPASTLNSTEVKYALGASGTVIPASGWVDNPPAVPQGSSLWTRTTLTFNNGDPVVFYTASRQGYDGTGAAGTSTPLMDTPLGDVGVSPDFAREDHSHPVSTLHIQVNVTELPMSINNAAITTDMRVINCVIASPNAITSDLSWTTTSANLTIDGSLKSSSSTVVDFDLAVF